MKLKQFTFTFLTLCLVIVFGPKAAEAVTLTPIADGLNNASGLSEGPDGTIYVGETGTGGDGKCQPSPSTVGQPICSGNTGAVAKITPDGEQSEIFSGFESLALQPSQNQGAGPQALEFDSQGNAYLLTGYAGFPGNRDQELNALTTNLELPPEQYIIAPPVAPEDVLNTTSLGKLYEADLLTGELTEIFDFAEYEVLNNPDGGDVITNPYALAISGDTAYVNDGGGNVVYSIELDGSGFDVTQVPTQTVKNPEFPPPPPEADLPEQAVDNPVFGNPDSDPSEFAEADTDESNNQLEPPPQLTLQQGQDELDLQSVPTGNAIGPDGAVYFGEYTGYPYPEGEARIFRLGKDGKLEVYADGFTHVADVAFDKDGNLLVLQFSDQAEWKGKDIQNLPGSLIQVSPDGTKTTLVAAGEGLGSATSLLVSDDNQIYVTNNGVGPGQGEVLLVNTKDVPEPTTALGVLAFGALGGGALLKRKQKA